VLVVALTGDVARRRGAVEVACGPLGTDAALVLATGLVVVVARTREEPGEGEKCNPAYARQTTRFADLMGAVSGASSPATRWARSRRAGCCDTSVADLPARLRPFR